VPGAFGGTIEGKDRWGLLGTKGGGKNIVGVPLGKLDRTERGEKVSLDGNFPEKKKKKGKKKKKVLYANKGRTQKMRDNNSRNSRQKT